MVLTALHPSALFPTHNALRAAARHFRFHRKLALAAILQFFLAAGNVEDGRVFEVLLKLRVFAMCGGFLQLVNGEINELKLKY